VRQNFCRFKGFQSSLLKTLTTLKEQIFRYEQTFLLESGQTLQGIEIAYWTYGTLNADKSNVVWVCHALTANAIVSEWWGGLVGETDFFNPKEHFLICANVLGSCYGTSSPVTKNFATNQTYYTDFPSVTIRDMVSAHDLLRQHLGLEKFYICIGGSLGGQQALEWAIQKPDLMQNLIVLATNAQHSAWGIAFNESQRMAIKADQTWQEHRPDAGQAGLAAARSIALLSYRNYDTYVKTQTDDTNEKTDHYKVISYQRYQGDKLVKRFHVLSYFILSQAMDSHNVGRNRGSVERVLQSIKAKTLVIGIRSDVLFPTVEQLRIAQYIPNAQYVEIDSDYGHDGFLVEVKKVEKAIRAFLNPKPIVLPEDDF